MRINRATLQKYTVSTKQNVSCGMCTLCMLHLSACIESEIFKFFRIFRICRTVQVVGFGGQKVLQVALGPYHVVARQTLFFTTTLAQPRVYSVCGCDCSTYHISTRDTAQRNSIAATIYDYRICIMINMETEAAASGCKPETGDIVQAGTSHVLGLVGNDIILWSNNHDAQSALQHEAAYLVKYTNDTSAGKQRYLDYLELYVTQVFDEYQYDQEDAAYNTLRSSSFKICQPIQHLIIEYLKKARTYRAYRGVHKVLWKDENHKPHVGWTVQLTDKALGNYRTREAAARASDYYANKNTQSFCALYGPSPAAASKSAAGSSSSSDVKYIGSKGVDERRADAQAAGEEIDLTDDVDAAHEAAASSDVVSALTSGKSLDMLLLPAHTPHASEASASTKRTATRNAYRSAAKRVATRDPRTEHFKKRLRLKKQREQRLKKQREQQKAAQQQAALHQLVPTLHAPWG